MKSLSEMNTLIELRSITKAFDGEQVLCGIDLDIHDKEFVTLLGPSGCGKTTTLRIIGGFETADTGDVFFDGERINDLPPHKRHVNTVFQKYALFPHLNVYDNVAFGLRVQKVGENEIKERVKEMLVMTGLRGFENRKPATLSGGQQQRVAIARTLIHNPEIMLFDEPMSALDVATRLQLREVIKQIQADFGTTMIYITHDQEEAFAMSDRIIVMDNAEICQIDTPANIVANPANNYVKSFVVENLQKKIHSLSQYMKA